MQNTEQKLREALSSLNELITQGRVLGWEAHPQHMRMMTRARATSHAIQAALAQPAECGEVVGSITISMFKGHLENRDFDYFGNLPPGTYQLYTTPPASQAQADTIAVQEAWEAAGGNPGIKATKVDLLAALRMLDEVCDKASQEPKRINEVDLGPLKAELTDPEKAKAFLRNAGILNERDELAEAFGGAA